MWCKWAPVAVGHQRHLKAQGDQECKTALILYLCEGILRQKDVSTFNCV